MFTGLDEVRMHRERMQAMPLDGSSTKDSREFLTLNLMP